MINVNNDAIGETDCKFKDIVLAVSADTQFVAFYKDEEVDYNNIVRYMDLYVTKMRLGVNNGTPYLILTLTDSAEVII